MKKLLVTGLIAATLAVSSAAVFAADTSTNPETNSIDSLVAKVVGVESDEISELRAEGVGYGRLIPASILSKKLDITLKEAVNLRETGKTYAEVAEENGITLDEYKNELLEKRQELVDERVEEGFISEEQGNLMKERMEENIANCDGEGSGFGQGNGGYCGGLGQGMMGSGRGQGRGMGRGNGFGQGRGWSK